MEPLLGHWKHAKVIRTNLDSSFKFENVNKTIDYPAPSLRMCGESIDVTKQYKDGATS